MTTNLAIKINDPVLGKHIVMASDTQETWGGVADNFNSEKIWLPTSTNYMFQIAGHSPFGKTVVTELQESWNLFYGLSPGISWNLQNKKEIESAVNKTNSLLREAEYPPINFTFAMQDSLNIFLIHDEKLVECGERMYSGKGGYEAYLNFYERREMKKHLDLRNEVFNMPLDFAIEQMSNSIVEVSRYPKYRTGGFVDVAYMNKKDRELKYRIKTCPNYNSLTI